MELSHNSDRNSFRSLFAFPWNVFIAVIAFALLLRVFAIQMYSIPSGSMEPTLHVGDRILVEKVTKYARGIQRGDIVVFDGADVWTAPSASDDFVKRVVAVGGDHVQCCTNNGRIVVNGVPVDEPYLQQQGVTDLDLGGINTHDLPGISRFKLGTGGRVLTLAGTYF